MKFWLARLLGRADGGNVVRCGVCDTLLSRDNAIRGADGWACSEACAGELQAINAW